MHNKCGMDVCHRIPSWSSLSLCSLTATIALIYTDDVGRISDTVKEGQSGGNRGGTEQE